MLKCLVCGRQTEVGEPTGKFITKIPVKYPNDIIGNRIVSEIKCCVACSGEEMLEEEKEIDINCLTHDDLSGMLSPRRCFKCGKNIDNEPKGFRCCPRCRKK